MTRMAPIVALLAVISSPALAQTPTPARAVQTSSSAVVTSSVATASAEDARGLVRTHRFEPEDAVLFVPRLLMVPPRFALEVVFWPLRQGLRLVEKYYVVEHVEDFLYNDARTAGVMPSLLGFPGAGLSGGLRLFHNDLFGNDESLSVAASFGGLYTQSYRVNLSADHVGGTRLWFEGEASYEAKPNLYFSGIGEGDTEATGTALNPYSAATQTRFSEQRYLTNFRFGTMHGRPGRLIRTGLSVTYNHRRFDAAQRLTAGQLDTTLVYDSSLIPGFQQGADTMEVTADLILDYRDHPARATDGYYVEAFVGGVPQQGNWQYFHWGVEASTYFELWAKERVLVLRAFVEGVEGNRDKIPFTELPRLGGPRRLRGYQLNTFRDEKAILGTVEYRWHVHQYITASLFVDVGQVNDNYIDLVLTGDDAHWKAGFGGGLRIGSERTTLVNIDLAYGDRFTVLVSTEPLKAFDNRTKQL